jgi:hypothetical protein
LAGIRGEFERLPRRLFGLGFGSVVIRGRLQLIVTQRTGYFSHSINAVASRRPCKALHVTRVWVKRDEGWVETLSYQTAVNGTVTK